MKFAYSENPRTIRIYNLAADTNEFIGAGDAYIAPHTGLPAHSTEVVPPTVPKGFVAVWNQAEYTWLLLEDNRQAEVYDTRTGLVLFIDKLGPIPELYTKLKPTNQFPLWDGKAWVNDEAAQKEHDDATNLNSKNELMHNANVNIATLTDATDEEVMGAGINPDDIDKLNAWKKYRVLLSRVDITKPEWPALPNV